MSIFSGLWANLYYVFYGRLPIVFAVELGSYKQKFGARLSGFVPHELCNLGRVT